MERRYGTSSIRSPKNGKKVSKFNQSMIGSKSPNLVNLRDSLTMQSSGINIFDYKRSSATSRQSDSFRLEPRKRNCFVKKNTFFDTSKYKVSTTKLRKDPFKGRESTGKLNKKNFLYNSRNSNASLNKLSMQSYKSYSRSNQLKQKLAHLKIRTSKQPVRENRSRSHSRSRSRSQRNSKTHHFSRANKPAANLTTGGVHQDFMGNGKLYNSGRLNLSSNRISLRDAKAQKLNTSTISSNTNRSMQSFLQNLKFYKNSNQKAPQSEKHIDSLAKHGNNTELLKKQVMSKMISKHEDLFSGLSDKQDKELAVQIMGLIQEFKKDANQKKI